MIAISAIFCLLAVSCVHCKPPVGAGYREEIEHWVLEEAWVSFEEELPTEHHPGPLQLIRYDNMFCLDKMRRQIHLIIPYNILCFEVSEFYAVLGNMMYVITLHPRRVVRMAAQTHEIKFFKRFFVPETHDQTFVMRNRYVVEKILESDDTVNVKRIASSDSPEIPIMITELAGVNRIGNDTGRRRFIISGGFSNELYAVFNDGDYNYIQNDIRNGFVFEVRPPGGFPGKMYYGLTLACHIDALNIFAEDMRRHASTLIAVPEMLIFLSNL